MLETIGRACSGDGTPHLVPDADILGMVHTSKGVDLYCTAHAKQFDRALRSTNKTRLPENVGSIWQA